MHGFRIVTLEREGLIPVATNQLFKLLVRNTRQHRGVGDLVAIQMKNGQHRTVRLRIEKLVGVPACRQWPRLRLSVADHAGYYQVRIVEGRSIRVQQRVAQFSALVNRPRRLRRNMARNAERPAELTKKSLDAVGVLLDRRKKLGVGTFQIRVGHDARSAVPRANHINHVQITLDDGAVQVDVEKVQTGCRTEVAEQPWLDILNCQRLLEQRIVLKVDLAHGQIVGGAPVGVHLVQHLGGERCLSVACSFVNLSVVGENRFIRHGSPHLSS